MARPVLAGTPEILAPLLDPAKFATLIGDRPKNRRLYLILGYLETARQNGENPGKVVGEAIQLAGISSGWSAAAR